MGGQRFQFPAKSGRPRSPPPSLSSALACARCGKENGSPKPNAGMNSRAPGVRGNVKNGALRAAKTRGVILGNAKQAEANRSDADAFAESLRPIVAPFIHLSSRRIAKVLNDRGIKSPTGKAWTWNDLIKTAAENGELGKGKYSYVSLFGLNSL